MVIEAIVTAHSLDEIVGHRAQALLRRFKQNRDVIIGFIGERGSGKSLGGANVAIRDYMMSGEPCWSNMQIKLNVDVSDKWANQYGIEKGGLVTYEAQHLERQDLLSLNGQYEGGVIYIDEPNIEYGEARRSNTNTNIATDMVVQQLRKFQSALIYSVINEMYVDVRIRENTDIIIRCHDVAFKPNNMRVGMEQGHVFEWQVYLLSEKVAGIGNTYNETKKPHSTIPITLGNMWGSIDTYERQRNIDKYSGSKKLIPVDIIENPESVVEKDKWSWLYRKIDEFYEKHRGQGDYIEVTSSEMRKDIGVTPELWGYTVRKIKELIPDIETRGKGTTVNPTIYTIPNRILV